MSDRTQAVLPLRVDVAGSFLTRALPFRLSSSVASSAASPTSRSTSRPTAVSAAWYVPGIADCARRERRRTALRGPVVGLTCGHRPDLAESVEDVRTP
ncbi:hypothetical protein WDZ17_00135 [Pseudokineococcus basanitobsidens]|uniref:Uncharacterized protein n=1 Tax=Pseudokineococcus basanitobsidens TaxID=1926649 RepID=A0ABU8RFE2_9ACTN